MQKNAKKAQGEWMHHGQWGAGKTSRWLRWWFLPFEILGLMGPLIGALVSLAFTVALLWIAKLVNVILQSGFISLMIGAADRNIAWFFIVPLVVGYCQHLAKKSHAGYLVFLPIGNAASTTFSLWMLAWVFKTVGALSSVPLLFQIGVLLRENLAPIFALVLILGYLSAASRHFARAR
ncbi:MAG: hypothetical protein WC717_03975 [Candidatus Micrarchaeia archaeon]|jgi:hypothetical protein